MLALIDDLLWGKLLVLILITLGLRFTIKSRFVQFRYLGQMIGVLRQRQDPTDDHLSSFQALILSVAGRVGAGNIAGVAAAITLGGPGAIFWMWLVGLVGMSTSFFECTLAQVFKRAESDGSYRGGPAHYIAQGLGQKWLSSLFSILLLVTFGFGFNALQSYTVAASLQDTLGIPPQMAGVLLLSVMGLVIFGGIRRIAEFAERIVPVVAVGYFAMALFVIFTHLSEIPTVLTLIFKSAFGLEPALGGGVGVAILFGVKRGLFSNEAGLGSAPNVAAVAYVKHPVNQGIVQAFSVFIDTIVLCSCTAAIILLSSVYGPGGDELGGIVLTQAAMADHVWEWGRAFVTLSLVLFAFTSMIYNYYLGENSLNFFSEENQTLFTGFRILTLGLIGWGASQDLTTVFGFADITMGVLALVNLIALALLFNVGLRVMRDFDHQIMAGRTEPVFNPDDFADLNIDREAWALTDPHPTPSSPSEGAPAQESISYYGYPLA